MYDVRDVMDLKGYHKNDRAFFGLVLNLKLIFLGDLIFIPHSDMRERIWLKMQCGVRISVLNKKNPNEKYQNKEQSKPLFGD